MTILTWSPMMPMRAWASSGGLPNVSQSCSTCGPSRSKATNSYGPDAAKSEMKATCPDQRGNLWAGPTEMAPPPKPSYLGEKERADGIIPDTKIEETGKIEVVRERRIMVLWEIALGTAYFLGLKRTFKLALRAQRRLVGPNHPQIRHFLHRRTRAIFDIALKVHRSIQERDIEVGRNLGNRILRFLDRLKPSAQIRGGGASTSMMRQVNNGPHQKSVGSTNQKSSFRGVDQDSSRHLFSSSKYVWHKPLPPIRMIMRPPTFPATTTTQYRHTSYWSPQVVRSSCRSAEFDGVIRKDIMQWMLQN